MLVGVMVVERRWGGVVGINCEKGTWQKGKMSESGNV